MTSIPRPSRRSRSRRALTTAVISAVLATGLGVVPIGSTEPAPAQAADRKNPATAPDTQTAQRTAASTGESVEVLELRTERSTTVANPDGTFTQTESVQPVRTRKDGAWQAIDTTLERRSDGTWAPKAAVSTMSFSGGGDQAFARIEKDGRELALSWPGDLPEPQVEGSTATYANVLPGVDLRLHADAEGFSHILVVKDAKAAANPALTRLELPVRTTSLDLSETQSGTVEARDASGSGVVFEAPKPQMWDSSGPAGDSDTGGVRTQSLTADDTSSADSTPPDGVQVADVAVDVSGGVLALEPDTDLLTGSGTTYPVYIDPVVKTANRSAWTMVSSYHSSSEFWKFSDDEGVGRCPANLSFRCSSSSDVKRQFFALPTGAFEDKDIISAEFAVTMVHTYSDSGRTVQLGRVNSSGASAINSGTNWGNQPSLKENLASQSPTNPAGSCTSTNQNVRFNVKSTLQKASTYGWDTTTFRLAAGSESDYSYWKRFCGNANLEVTYNRPPAQSPMGDLRMAPGGNCEYGRATEHYVSAPPKLTAVIRDYDHGDTGGNSERLKAQFRVWWTVGGTTYNHYATTAAKSTVDSSWSDQTGVATFTYTVGSDLSGDGQAGFTVPQNTVIGWTVRGHDGTSYGPWSLDGDATRCEFIYDATVPKAPVVTSDRYPDDEQWHAGVGDYGTFTFDSPSTDVASYRYRFKGESWRYVNAAKLGGPASTTWMPPDEGPMFVDVLAVDDAGNAQKTPTTYSFNVGDGRAPTAGWTLGDAAGSSQAAGTGNSPPAAAGDGVTFGRTGPLGGADTSVFLDGSDGAYLDAGAPSVDTGSTFSVSAWVNLAQQPDGDVTVVSQDGVAQPGFDLGYDADTQSWTFSIPVSDMQTMGSWTVSGAKAVPGTWTHLIGTYDNVTGNMSLFVNGDLIEKAVKARHTVWSANGALQIGRKIALDGYTNHLHGGAADVKLYDRVITAAEGLSLGGIPVRQLAYWQVDSATASVSPDAHGGTGLTLGGQAAIYLPDDSCDPALDPECTLPAEPLWGDGHLQLNGTDAYAARTAGLLAQQDGFTLTGRARLAAAVPTRDQTVLSLAGTGNSAVTIKYLASAQRWAMVTTNAAGTSATSTTTIATGALPSSEGKGDHLALIYSAVFGEVRLYVNGTLAATTPWDNTWDFTTTSLQVGRSLNGTSASAYFAGALDELRVFAGDLDTSAVAQVSRLPAGSSIGEPDVAT
ncbi:MULTISPECIES: LamG domain-containing protein [Streptomyces]|uniref:LamG domain-containing protein n=1 Tax=Streptomyces TaxID=1883 RepID=UPI001CC0C9C1|nr:LamG domain-containing protein [Streptomyces sp. A144]UAX58408.1 LamG domain-containing protein [Streptomyces sp. A144]